MSSLPTQIPDPRLDPEFMKMWREYKQTEHRERQRKLTDPYFYMGLFIGVAVGCFFASVTHASSHPHASLVNPATGRYIYYDEWDMPLFGIMLVMNVFLAWVASREVKKIQPRP